MSNNKYINKTKISSIYSDNIEELMTEHGQFAFVVDKNDFVVALKNKTTGVMEYKYTDELPIVKKILKDIQELKLEHSEEIIPQIQNAIKVGVDSLVEYLKESCLTQPDWDEDDTESWSYIKNKPSKLSDFENDKNYIDKAVEDLDNYYDQETSDLRFVQVVKGKDLSTNDFDNEYKLKLDNIHEALDWDNDEDSED